MSLLLAVGLQLTSALGRLNGLVARLVSSGAAETFPKQLPDWGIWLATLFAAFGMALAILLTAGLARRFLLWLTAVLLIAAWAPVLALAAHDPAIAAPWVATVWSGACSMFYASRHRMPCDEIPPDYKP